MMIIEGMKRLRTIEKQMGGNIQDIQRYASLVSTEVPAFGTHDDQKSRVMGFVQSNTDLMKEYLKLKMQLEWTNLSTKVEFSGELWTISELLVIRRKLAQTMMQTYNALNDNAGTQRLRQAPQGPDGSMPQILRMYKEDDKLDGLRRWQDLYHAIDGRLEVINATTPMCELPCANME